MSSSKIVSRLTRLITFALLVSLLPIVSVSAQTPAALPSPLASIGCDPNEFVKPYVNTFRCEGSNKTFKFIGVNIRPLAYIDTIALPNQQFNNWDEEVTEQLTAAQYMGASVVRIYISKHDKTATEAAVALARLLNKAAVVAPRIKFLVTLTDFLQESEYYVKGDDGCQTVEPPDENYSHYACSIFGQNYRASRDWYNDRGGLLETGWFDTGYQQNYRPFVGTIVSQFKDDPRIFAWQLGNELQIGTDPWPTYPKLDAFVSDMSTYIKQTLGARQMVTTGFKFISNAVSEALPIDHEDPNIYDLARLMDDIYLDPNIAFGSFHSYDSDWNRPDLKLEYEWYLNHNKPYIVGEISYSAGPTGRTDCGRYLDEISWNGTLIPSAFGASSFDRSRALLPTIQKYMERYQASGVLQWGFATGGTNGTNDDCRGMDILSEQPGRDWLPLYTMYRCLAIDLSQNLLSIGRNCAAQTVDTVLIIDSSGSMSSNDPANRRHDAARAYLNAAPDNDFAGVVDFDELVRTWKPVVRIGPNRSVLDTAIGQIDAYGGTNIGLGLQRGCDELIAASTAQDPSPNVYKAAILLTDGVGDRADQHLCFTAHGWPVYTFGFGQANDTQLADTANATGGEYKRLTTENLACEFQQVRAKIGRGTVSPCTTSQVNPGATTTLNQSVPINQERATFSASRPSGSDVVLSLRSPSGRTIDRTTSAADVVRNQGSTFESYSIARPESGTWQINLHGANVPSGGAQVVIGSSTVPAPAAAIPTAEAGGPYTAIAGQPVTLDASGSRDQDGTIARYQWDVTSDGVFDSTTTVPMLAHTYTTTGTVTLTLKVTDNDGRVASDTATVTIQPPTRQIDAYVRGNDMELYRRRFQNNAWGAWQAVTAMPGAAGSQPAVVAGANGQLDIFVRGTDNALHQRTFKNNTWSAWQSLSGGLQSDPIAVPGANGRIDVYIRSTDLGLYRRTFQNNAWGAWQSVTAMPGGAGSQPAVVAGANGQLDIFVRGTDNALHQRTFKNNVWTAWQSLSGGLQSDPIAVPGANGRIDVYIRGNDMELYRRTFQNNAWGAWQAVTAMPGGAGSQPAVVAGPNGQLDIFVRGTDNALHQRTFKNNVWSAWQSLSGGLQSDPTVLSKE